MKQAIGSDCRNPKDHSKKDCCCGSHSANDRKKSRTHHATATKIQIRKSRKAKLDAFINEQQDIPLDIALIINDNFEDLYCNDTPRT